MNRGRGDEIAHGSGVSHGNDLVAVHTEILGDGVPKVRLVLDNCNPGAQCGLASAVAGK